MAQEKDKDNKNGEELSSEIGVYGSGFVKKLDGYWVLSELVPRVRVLQESFVGRPGDILLASLPKTGTTWLKALLHCIQSSSSGKDLLGEYNPHSIVPFLEFSDVTEWQNLPSPRLLHTHLPLHALPKRHSSCKILYITRNPRDTFVSYWKFYDRLAQDGAPMAGYFDAFCKGHFHAGPFEKHVSGYLRESRANPDRVMFLRYEDLQNDCRTWIVKIGLFLGYPETVMRNKAAARCSFKALSSTDVNRGDARITVNNYAVPSASFFRAGRSGEWNKYFTLEMEGRIREDIEIELEQEGIFFAY